VTEPEQLRDPREMDDEELAEVPVPPAPANPLASPATVTEDEYALGRTNDPDGARRDAPAGEDYAGSGF
jgi:hypothetical protein